MTGRFGMLALTWALAVLTLAACPSSRAADSAKDRGAAWRDDIAFLGRELPRRHANAFHHLPKAQFEQEIAALSAAAPGLEDDQVVVGLMKVLAKVGDGHTNLRMPPSFQRYPLVLFAFADGWRVTQAAEPYRAILGGRLIAIDGVDIETVKARLSGVIAQDENCWFALATMPGYMVRPGVLHGLGVAGDNGPARFTVETDGGGRVELDVAPAAPEPLPAMIDAAASAPLFRQRPQERFWSVLIPSTRTVYAAFRSYEDMEGQAKALFRLIDEAGADRLIFDMRENPGGDFTKVREQVIPQIKKRPSLNRKGGLYVLIGRRTFSAAMSNASDFRRETPAILVGEPAGEKPNSYQESRRMELPNSKLTVSYSTKFYRFADTDIEAIVPDKLLEPAWADYKAGRDPVLEWIMAQP
jgi:hypothetical protein